MPRGPKKHLKRLNAPKHWMLDKLGGVFAPKPSPGPHQERECLPLARMLRNRLKYALTFKEVKSILMQRNIKVDGKIKTDSCYPCGFMDVLDIDKTDEHFRLIYDQKGRFVVHRIQKEEAQYKLGRVKTMLLGDKGVPFVTLHDGRTIRYPDPTIKVNDTVMVDIATNKITSSIKFDIGQMVMIMGGRNRGRVGYMQSREKHKGSHEIIHIKDANGAIFATRAEYVFVIGEGSKPQVSLPKAKGIKLSIVEEMYKRSKSA
jgi:small subunit ribosomal protein S4e